MADTTAMADITAREFATAKARGEARLRGPRAESVCYDAAADRLVLRLTSGVELRFVTPTMWRGWQDATPAQLAQIEITEFGLGIHLPALDADLYVPALANGVLGSHRWTAAKDRRRTTVKS